MVNETELMRDRMEGPVLRKLLGLHQTSESIVTLNLTTWFGFDHMVSLMKANCLVSLDSGLASPIELGATCHIGFFPSQEMCSPTPLFNM